MFHPLTPRCAICSAWHPCWPRPGRRPLRLRQSRTFPISHPSTRLCLELLIQACRERHVLTLLDVGCGSGILALSAAVLGVPRCVGCDLSAAAVQVSQENARRHRLEDRLVWVQGSTEAFRPAFHLVAANLPYQVQLAKQEEFQRLLHPRGCLIISGFRDTWEDAIAGFYLGQGWRVQRRLTYDRWEPELPQEKSYTWVGLSLAP